MVKFVKRKLKILAATLSIAYIVLLVLLYTQQNRLLYHPSKESFDNCELGEKVKKSDLLRLYRIKSVGETQRRIVFFHGNASRACNRGKRIIENLTDPGTEIQFFEYPGFAEEKNPDQDSILRATQEWADYVQAEGNSRIILIGESLGTGVATFASTLVENSGLILFSPYSSIADVGSSQYPFVPVRLLMRDMFEASTWAQKTKSPKVLMFHGGLDNVIPISIGRRQEENFSIPKEFVPYADRGHNDLTRSNSDLWGRVKTFVN